MHPTCAIWCWYNGMWTSKGLEATCHPGMRLCRLLSASAEGVGSGRLKCSGRPMLPRLLRLELWPLRVTPVPTLRSTGCEECVLSLAPTFRKTLSRALCRENAGLGVCPLPSAACHEKVSERALTQC